MRSAIIAVAGAWLAACQSSDVSREVGARCDVADDCDQLCLAPGTDYPGGFCSIACNTRSDCPSNSTCADLEAGVCLFSCASDADCGFLGATWTCQSVDLRGGGIKVTVCRGA